MIYFIGLLILSDPPRDDTKLTIKKAKMLGIQIKMITGDQKAIAIETCKLIGLGSNIQNSSYLTDHENVLDIDDIILKSDGFAEVFPEHKFLIVDKLQKMG